MKITTNPIGNYSVNKLPKINRSNKAEKLDNSDTGVLSKSEKNFFTRAYPANKSEIMDYHFYNADGKFSGVAVGNNIDRRG